MPNIINKNGHFKLFSFFSIFWSISTLTHQFIWPQWSEHGIPLGWVLSFFCVLYLITLAKYKILFIIAILTSSLWYILREPFGVNHMLFEAIMSITMSIVFISYYISKQLKKQTLTIQEYFANNAIPLLRTNFILLYFFVVLHKLNFDFFKTDISCGAVLFENLVNNLYLTRISFFDNFYSSNQILLGNFSIYSALLAEILIPILLIFKKSRKIGLILGLIFHFLLGLEGLGAIVSFTTMMFTYLSLFWDGKTINLAINYIAANKNKIRVAFIIFLLILLISFMIVSERFFKQLFGVFWIAYSISIIIFFIILSKVRVSSNTIKFSPTVYLYWIFPLIFILNGFSPYLGLKTQTVFSMFSNLKTENSTTNHFFIPKELQLFDYQKQIVIINETNMVGLKSPDTWNNTTNYNYVLFEFIRKLNSINEGYVSFNVNEKEYYVKKENSEILMSNIELNQNAILKKILLFRPVYSGANLCQQ